MATKAEIEKRRLDIKKLIGQGLRMDEVRDKIGVPRRTFDRDLAEIRKEILESPEQHFSIKRILELRDNVLRGVLVRLNNAKTEESYLKAAQTANNVITEMKKDYAQMGLVPSEKQTIEMQGNMGVTLTDLKMKAIEAIEKEKLKNGNRSNGNTPG